GHVENRSCLYTLRLEEAFRSQFHHHESGIGSGSVIEGGSGYCTRRPPRSVPPNDDPVPASISCLLVAAQRHRQAERLELLHQHVERLRDPGLGQVLALDDRLVDTAAARNIVGLHREDLLERVCGAVRLERPHLHLSETLAAELCLTGQRLLRHERVWTDRTRVDLV